MKIYVRAIASVMIGALLLWLSIRNINLNETRSALAKAPFEPLLIALAIYWLALSIRIFRWRALLSGVSELRVLQVARALIIGYAANNVLPARLGELYRVDFVRRQRGLARSAVLGSVIMERLEDAVAALALLTLGLVFATQSTGNATLVYVCIAAGGIIAVGIAAGRAFRHLARAFASRAPSLATRARGDLDADNKGNDRKDAPPDGRHDDFDLVD